jgi:hypothetical protein
MGNSSLTLQEYYKRWGDPYQLPCIDNFSDYYDRLEFFLKIGKTDLPVQLNREATRAKISSRITLFELTGSRISKCK